MVSDRRVARPVSPVSEASADLPGSWSRGCRLSASVLRCPLVVLSGKGTSLFPDWALSSPERTQGPWAIGGEGRRGPRGPISDTVEPKIPSSPGTITTCSLMLELSQWSLTTLPQDFTFLDASCTLSQTLAGRAHREGETHLLPLELEETSLTQEITAHVGEAMQNFAPEGVTRPAPGEHTAGCEHHTAPARRTKGEPCAHRET